MQSAASYDHLPPLETHSTPLFVELHLPNLVDCCSLAGVKPEDRTPTARHVALATLF